jgi:hypothetical protein
MLLDRDTTSAEDEAGAQSAGTGEGAFALNALEEGTVSAADSGLSELSVADQLVRRPYLLRLPHL